MGKALDTELADTGDAVLDMDNVDLGSAADVVAAADGPEPGLDDRGLDADGPEPELGVLALGADGLVPGLAYRAKLAVVQERAAVCPANAAADPEPVVGVGPASARVEEELASEPERASTASARVLEPDAAALEPAHRLVAKVRVRRPASLELFVRTPAAPRL